MLTTDTIRLSLYNKDAIVKSTSCGCYFCIRIFESVEIVDWLTEKNNEDTALCPNCGMDTVIPNVTDVSTLSEANKLYFCQTSGDTI